jgi:DNA-binding transcriptional ArsR family regulator
MPASFATLLPRLRAIAEPTRLRLLAVLSRGEFSVSELTTILGQSQPRVSRHLKLLDDCGMLERFREQHWIYYRLAGDAEGGRLARRLLEFLDVDDAALSSDRTRVQRVIEARSSPHAADGADHAPAPEELVALLSAELQPGGTESLLYVGPAPGDVLAGLAARAGRAVGVSRSRRAVQRARAIVHSAGLRHCVLQQGELPGLPQASGSFELVIVDRALAAESHPADALREAARVRRAGGRLLVLEDFEALDRRAPGGNPLALLRGWLAEAGLACDRLRPCDVNGAHLLLAAAADSRAVAA